MAALTQVIPSWMVGLITSKQITRIELWVALPHGDDIVFTLMDITTAINSLKREKALSRNIFVFPAH